MWRTRIFWSNIFGRFNFDYSSSNCLQYFSAEFLTSLETRIVSNYLSIYLTGTHDESSRTGQYIYSLISSRYFVGENRSKMPARLWRIDSPLHFNFTGRILVKKERKSSSGSFTTDQPEFASFFLRPPTRRFRNKREVLSLESAREFLVGCVRFEARSPVSYRTLYLLP